MGGSMPVFKGFRLPLVEAIDALIAYDRGATDSGVDDESLKREVLEHLQSLDDLEFRETCAEYCRRFLTDEAIAKGYGMSNILSFGEWLAENGIDAL
jgi:hypothetical protein